MTPLQARALRALPSNASAVRWPTSEDLVARIGVAPDVARSTLTMLRRRDLVEHDGEHPRAFARTLRGEVALEHTDV